MKAILSLSDSKLQRFLMGRTQHIGYIYMGQKNGGIPTDSHNFERKEVCGADSGTIPTFWWEYRDLL